MRFLFSCNLWKHVCNNNLLSTSSMFLILIVSKCSFFVGGGFSRKRMLMTVSGNALRKGGARHFLALALEQRLQMLANYSKMNIFSTYFITCSLLYPLRAIEDMALTNVVKYFRGYAFSIPRDP